MLWLKSVHNLALSVAALGCLSLAYASTTPASPASTPSAKKKTVHHTSAKSASTSHNKHGKHSRKGTKKVRGQQKIDPQRAHDIQEALIRNHYMSGTPTGTWDASSQKAMEKFQADNGWQTKEIPDSRALIKLGLGPDHQHLLNPESAMTTPDKIKPPTQAKAPTIPSTAPAATAPTPADSASQN